MMGKKRQRTIMIELQGQLIKLRASASETERPADVSLKVREMGWLPYRVRFDESQTAWVVSSLDALRS